MTVNRRRFGSVSEVSKQSQAKGDEMEKYEIETPVEAATRKYRRVIKAMHRATKSCSCGARGSWHWSKTVSGTVSGNPAMWQGCERCGAAIGAALTGDQMYAAMTVAKAADDLGEDIDDWVRHIQMDDVLDSCDRSAALQRRREAARQ